MFSSGRSLVTYRFKSSFSSTSFLSIISFCLQAPFLNPLANNLGISAVKPSYASWNYIVLEIEVTRKKKTFSKCSLNYRHHFFLGSLVNKQSLSFIMLHSCIPPLQKDSLKIRVSPGSCQKSKTKPEIQNRPDALISAHAEPCFPIIELWAPRRGFLLHTFLPGSIV